jgi:lipoate-protein ligase B
MTAAVSAPVAVRAAWLGRVDYRSALELQRATHARRVARAVADTVLLLEHDHVITRGRRGTDADILATPTFLSSLSVEVVDTDRGGQTTYHGPGQLVGYPVIDLKAVGLGPVTYVRLLERTLIETLAVYGVDGFQVAGQTGVWTAGGKIAAIGVRISAGVTMHGFALNVDTDLSYFEHIVPCGAPSAPAASVRSETGAAPGLVEAASEWAARFGTALGRDVDRITVDALAAPQTG